MMRTEIENGVNWIISQIENDSIFRHQAQLLVAFKQSLIETLLQQYEHHWYPSDPLKGSGFRCISFQSTARIEKCLYRAGLACGIRNEIIEKLFTKIHDRILCINPGDVKVVNTALYNQAYAQATILHSAPVELDSSNHSNVTIAMRTPPSPSLPSYISPSSSPSLSSRTQTPSPPRSLEQQLWQETSNQERSNTKMKNVIHSPILGGTSPVVTTVIN